MIIDLPMLWLDILLLLGAIQSMALKILLTD
jgi:hypothetical protein